MARRVARDEALRQRGEGCAELAADVLGELHVAHSRSASRRRPRAITWRFCQEQEDLTHHLAELFRKHLLLAKVDRLALHKSNRAGTAVSRGSPSPPSAWTRSCAAPATTRSKPACEWRRSTLDGLYDRIIITRMATRVILEANGRADFDALPAAMKARVLVVFERLANWPNVSSAKPHRKKEVYE